MSLEARAGLAVTFFEELLSSVESLGGIAEERGSTVLVDLFYLHGAILTGDCIDIWPARANALEVIRGLPSADEWLRHVRVHEHESQPAERAGGDAPG